MNKNRHRIFKWIPVILVFGLVGIVLLVQRDCYRIIPGTDVRVAFPCTWRSVPMADKELSTNTLQIEPWIRHNGILGVQVQFVRECAADNDACDPIEALYTLQNSIINQDRLNEVSTQAQFGPIQQLAGNNSKIYYMERWRPTIGTLILTGRTYVIRSDDKLFFVHSLRYSGANDIERFNSITDQIALSIR